MIRLPSPSRMFGVESFPEASIVSLLAPGSINDHRICNRELALREHDFDGRAGRRRGSE